MKDRWTDKLESLGSDVSISSIWWCYTKLDETFRGTIAEMICDLCQEKYIRDIERHIAADWQGRLLLRESCIKEKLQRLRGNEQASEEARGIARRLSFLPPPRPPLLSVPFWRDYRLSDPPDVAAGVRLLGLPANPFGPEQAELDPSLPDYPVYTKALQDVRGPRPTLLIGAPGCGKTAAALLLAYDCTYPPANPRESGAFPIYHTPRLDFPPEEARPSQLEALAKAVARVLLDSLASDPNAFLLHEEANQMAIVQLLAYCTGQTGNLVWRLRRAGSVAAGEGGQMLRQVQRLESILPADGPLDEDELIELLGKARPAGLSYTYALIDLSVEPANDEEAVAFAARLGPLFDLTVPLAMAGVYLKAFLPESLFRERDKSWKSERPDAGAIRELLTAAFSDEELQSFCFDNSDLKPVYEEFASGMSKIEKVRRLVEFSERRALLDKLLDKVQENNRQQYEKFRGRLYKEMAGELGAANADSWDEMSLLRPVPITWGQTGMEELLHSRLRWVGYQSLSALCDPEARVLDPDRRLVKAAEGSPRRLVRLGNRLLARVVTHPDEPPLTADDLNYVLGHE